MMQGDVMALQHLMILPKEFLINFLPIYEGPLTEVKKYKFQY